MILPIRLSLFAAGTSGAPTNTAVLLPPGELISYSDSVSDAFGFESMQATFVTTLEDAQAWFASGLMNSIVVSGPDAGVIWEGFVSGIELRIGGESRSVSLDTMANRIKCRYTTTTDTPGTTAAVSDTTSQGMYGIKDLVTTLPKTDAAAALDLATRLLALYKQPRPSGSISVATGGGADIQLTITGAGWYETLGWVVTSRTSTTSTSTTTQVGALLGTSSPGIGATNAFLSTEDDFIVSSGKSTTEYIEPDTPYREKIEALLNQGNSSGYSLAWGVYEGRIFMVEVAADSAPGTIHYRRSVGESFVRDTWLNPVAWWDVRPNRMYEVRELLDTNPAVIAPDAAGRSYIARVSRSVGAGQISLSLEGRTGESIDRIVARWA
jgi:hypothetical protein